MVDRFAQKTNKLGRVYKIGQTVPFNLEQFREWVLNLLSGAVDGAFKCFYCGAWVNIHTMVSDHRDPPNRGGSLGFDNLCGCCKSCNDVKGNLPEIWYRFLLKCLAEMPESIANDIKGRLRTSVQMTAGKQWARKKETKKAQEAANDGF